ncbi:hypothetical protein HON22_00820, partial [Candidatus Peregrinibacteria bacterium]|nr:hypothetical protein [Candidatus Peregrinibacteria bacterium]
ELIDNGVDLDAMKRTQANREIRKQVAKNLELELIHKDNFSEYIIENLIHNFLLADSIKKYVADILNALRSKGGISGKDLQHIIYGILNEKRPSDIDTALPHGFYSIPSLNGKDIFFKQFDSNFYQESYEGDSEEVIYEIISNDEGCDVSDGIANENRIFDIAIEALQKIIFCQNTDALIHKEMIGTEKGAMIEKLPSYAPSAQLEEKGGEGKKAEEEENSKGIESIVTTEDAANEEVPASNYFSELGLDASSSDSSSLPPRNIEPGLSSSQDTSETLNDSQKVNDVKGADSVFSHIENEISSSKDDSLEKETAQKEEIGSHRFRVNFLVLSALLVTGAVTGLVYENYTKEKKDAFLKEIESKWGNVKKGIAAGIGGEENSSANTPKIQRLNRSSESLSFNTEDKK